MNVVIGSVDNLTRADLKQRIADIWQDAQAPYPLAAIGCGAATGQRREPEWATQLWCLNDIALAWGDYLQLVNDRRPTVYGAQGSSVDAAQALSLAQALHAYAHSTLGGAPMAYVDGALGRLNLAALPAFEQRSGQAISSLTAAPANNWSFTAMATELNQAYEANSGQLLAAIDGPCGIARCSMSSYRYRSGSYGTPVEACQAHRADCDQAAVAVWYWYMATADVHFYDIVVAMRDAEVRANLSGDGQSTIDAFVANLGESVQGF